MYTIDQVQKILSEVADEIPAEFYEKLNGGVVLLEQAKPHPDSRGDLYIMGEYCHNAMGRTVFIYYGSFMRHFGEAPEELLRRELRETLRHELTHHWESLAGDKDLEIEDARQLWAYRNRKK